MRQRHREAPDAGFTLLEVVVAMVVFTVMASVALGLLVRTTGVARGNIQRTAATNVASQRIESVRSMRAIDIPDGSTTSTQVVGNTTYTLTQTAKYAPSESATSICTGTGNTLAYKLVTVSVTWPEMGSIRPVRSDTLKAVGIGADGLDSTKGSLAILVSGATGAAKSGVTVTLSDGTSRVTDSEGCAVFTGLTAGSTYTATANTAGWVGQLNTQSATVASLGVTANTVRRGTLLYDTRRSVVATMDSPAGAVVPAGLPLRVGGSYVPETTLPICPGTPTNACTTGTPGTVRQLFPEVYNVKVGTCSGTVTSSTSIDLRPTAADGSTVTVPVGAARVRVRLGSTNLANRTVTARSGTSTGCPTGDTYTTLSVTATHELVLPYGTWTFTTPNQVGTTTLTLSPTAKTGNAYLVVSS